MGMVIELNRDASNWSEVTNIVNYGKTFVSPDGKRFRLIRHKKAHYDENGNYKSGAQATVTIELDGKEQTLTTPKLKDLLNIQKDLTLFFMLQNPPALFDNPLEFQYQ